MKVNMARINSYSVMGSGTLIMIYIVSHTIDLISTPKTSEVES